MDTFVTVLFCFFFNVPPEHPQNFLDCSEIKSSVCLRCEVALSDVTERDISYFYCFALDISCTSPTSWLRRKFKGGTAEHTWPCMFALRQGGVATTDLFCTSETSRHAPAAVHLQPSPPLWVVAVYHRATLHTRRLISVSQIHHTHSQ